MFIVCHATQRANGCRVACPAFDACPAAFALSHDLAVSVGDLRTCMAIWIFVPVGKDGVAYAMHTGIYKKPKCCKRILKVSSNNYPEEMFFYPESL